MTPTERARALITVHDLGPVRIAVLGTRSIRAEDAVDMSTIVDDIVGTIASAIEAAAEERARAAATARDVAWVRACDTSIPWEGQHVLSAALGISTSAANDVLDAADGTDADIEAAIERARGT